MPQTAVNLGQALLRSREAFGDRVAILNPVDGVYVPIRYREYVATIRRYAGVLHGLGLQPGDRIAIQGTNSLEWAAFDWACQSLGLVVVPIYPTLPSDQAQYIVRDAGAKLVVTGDDEQRKKTLGMEGVGSLPLTGPDSLDAKAAESDMSEQEWRSLVDAVSPEALATIIYTSGTTGNPKGAMLTHRAFTELAVSVLTSLPVNENDVFFSFLPVSHVYERFAGHFLPTILGACIGYAQGLRTLANDLLQVRPTIMLCVPRFLEAFKGRVLDGAAKMPPVRRRLFEAALAAGAKRFRGEFSPFAGVLDALVGGKVRARTGGRLRFFVSGGAAMPYHVAEFFGAFRLQVLQGYGLTETTAATSFNPPDDNRPHTVGIPIQGVEVRIAPDGEILIRGSSRMVGYWNLPEETRTAIDEDGWFRSGDIGEFEGKHLKITDRKKDILVLGNGKNVAPAHIEGLLKESRYINEVVLFGDGMEYVCGLVVPEFDAVRAYLKTQGVEAKTDGEIAAHEATKKLIKAEIDRVNARLADYERVKKHAVLATPFSIETGELTPSLKVKRRVVKERHAETLAGLARSG
ncbi:MAG: long-chain fatty acid--CoA ligase [Fimbriimonadaceae bacterium]|nr:long-chain fatty acid--CoA ligase [Fimbriimonadaceae bacterium]